MKTSIYLSLFCAIIKLTLSLKSTEMCQMTEETRCLGEYGHSCETSYCAVDQESCNDFISLKTYFQMLKGSTVKKRLISLMSSIKPCPYIKIYQHPDDVCVSSQTCYSNKGRVHMAAKANANFMRRVYCACKATHALRCGLKYCAVDKMSCDQLHIQMDEVARINKKSSNSSVLHVVNNCVGKLYEN